MAGGNSAWALAYALPCNIDQVYARLTEDKVLPRDFDARRQQAVRVELRIIKDWVESQLALLATGMVEMEEIFLPYMLSGDRTLYQALMAGNFKTLESGQ